MKHPADPVAEDDFSEDPELLALCSALASEAASDAQLDRLDERLAASTEARDFYLRFMQIHGLLERYPLETGEVLGAQKLAATPPEAHGGSRIVALGRRLFSAGGLAAAALAVLSLVLVFNRDADSEGGRAGTTATTSIAVATLLLAEDCQWRSFPGKEPPREGARLSPGLWHLDSGTAVLRFDSGAELVLDGDSRLELSTAAAGTLHHGRVVVRADDGADGFALATPGGRFVDLGTEFAVRVEASGATELHVHEGGVAMSDAGSETVDGRVFAAGESIRIDEAGGVSSPPSADIPPRFRELVRRAGPRERRDLMQAYDGFNYDAGDYAPADIVRGHGWVSGWRLRRADETGHHRMDDLSVMRIAHGRMQIAWPVEGGVRGMLEMPPGLNVRIRQMSEALDSATDGISYFSFLVTEPGPASDRESTSAPTGTGANGNRPKRPRGDMRLTFRSSSDYFGTSLSFGWDATRRPRIQTDSGARFRATNQVPEGQTLLCVGKLLTRGVGEDEVTFRFYGEDDLLDFAEPAEWDVATRGLDLNAAFDLLLLTSQGDATRYFDEIRIGPTWRSVTPISSLPALTDAAAGTTTAH